MHLVAARCHLLAKWEDMAGDYGLSLRVSLHQMMAQRTVLTSLASLAAAGDEAAYRDDHEMKLQKEIANYQYL